jgi:hypothetical protein
MLLSLWNPARIVARGRYACNRFLPCLGILAILAAELLPGLGWAEPANADQPALVVVTRAGEQHFTAAELLARPDSAVVNVSGDIYDHAVSYRAVPLLALLGSTAGDGSDTVEAQASDGFVSQIPMQLIAQGTNGGTNGGAVAWLAVEDPAHPWPRLAQETGSAGPFYLIWEHPERSGVSRAMAVQARPPVSRGEFRSSLAAIGGAGERLERCVRQTGTRRLPRAVLSLSSAEGRRRERRRAGSRAADQSDAISHRSRPARPDPRSASRSYLARPAHGGLQRERLTGLRPRCADRLSPRQGRQQGRQHASRRAQAQLSHGADFGADFGADCARRANQSISSDSGLPKPAHGLKNRMRGNGNLRSQFKLICSVQSCLQKYSASMSASTGGYLLPSRTR